MNLTTDQRGGPGHHSPLMTPAQRRAYDQAGRDYDAECDDRIAEARRLHRRIPACIDPFERTARQRAAARAYGWQGY